MKGWMHRLFKAVDQKDVDAFIGNLTDDATFTFGNMPAVSGKSEIKDSVSGFFSTIKGLSHSISGWWEKDDVVITEGEVAYTRKDDSTVKYPFVNIFRMKDGLIDDYRIYIDTSTLYSENS